MIRTHIRFHMCTACDIQAMTKLALQLQSLAHSSASSYPDQSIAQGAGSQQHYVGCCGKVVWSKSGKSVFPKMTISCYGLLWGL